MPTTVSTPTPVAILSPLHHRVLWYLGRTCDALAWRLSESRFSHRSNVRWAVHCGSPCDDDASGDPSCRRRRRVCPSSGYTRRTGTVILVSPGMSFFLESAFMFQNIFYAPPCVPSPASSRRLPQVESSVVTIQTRWRPGCLAGVYCGEGVGPGS
jgi:hypothetical protein